MAYEIELKAHVYNRDEVISLLNAMKNARYLGHTEKKDTYYHFPLNSKISEASGKKHLTARIRKESLTFNGKTSELNYFTYKRKKNVEFTNPQTGESYTIEANEENEFTFEGETKSLEAFFEDLGATVNLLKEKSVEQWIVNTEDGEEAHVELCTVPKLGDFLEIEIIKSENSAETVEKCKKIEEKIFTDCNIPLNQIETRYYSDMLKALE